MEKKYKIKPLQWETEIIPTDQYGEGCTEHSAQGTNFYHIYEDSEGIEYTIFDEAGDFIRYSAKCASISEAKQYCEAHYLKHMKRNLIELT